MTDMRDIIITPEIIKAYFNIDHRHCVNIHSFAKLMTQSNTVNLAANSRLSNEKIEAGSVYRKYQRIFSKIELDEDKVAELVLHILGIPEDQEVVLVLDRTSWAHGSNEYNFLCLNVYT